MRQFVVQSALWSFLCAITELICRFGLHLGYPYNYPSVPIFGVFGDFRFWQEKFYFFHSREYYTALRPLSYPAPTVIFYKLFWMFPFIPHHALYATIRIVLIILITSWVMAAFLRRALIRRGLERRTATLFVLATYLMSFGFWFELHEANMEFILWVIIYHGLRASSHLKALALAALWIVAMRYPFLSRKEAGLAPSRLALAPESISAGC